MSREISVPSLFQLGYYWEAKIFLTSVKLDLYTPLAERPKTAKELSSDIKADASSLRRFLDALVTIGLLKFEKGCYSNIPQLAEFLVKTSPFYMGELMLLQDAEWDHWGKLEETIRTGRPIIKGNIFMNDPAMGATVLRVLHRMAKRVAPALAEKMDLSKNRSFLDVGGGGGAFSIAVSKRYPHLEMALFDLPDTLQVTKRHIEEEKLDKKIHLFGGNFNRDPLPGTFDVVFLSDILHYQTEEENAALFRKLYDTTNPGGKIIVKDMFINEDENNPGWNAVFSIHLMIYTENGRCFKGNLIRRWLEMAGFVNVVELEKNTVLTATRAE
ncbi:MAG: methyltransferase [Nitrospiria bacterium]